MNFDHQPNRPEILIVHPDRPESEQLQSTFTRMGYPTHACATGEEGLKYLETEASPIVFLSADLPGISGNETLQFIHSVQPMTQIIFMIGKHDVRDVMHSISGRIPNFLFRPFSDDLLQIAARKAEQNYRIEKEKWLYQEAIRRDIRIASRIQKQILAPDVRPCPGLLYSGTARAAQDLSGDFCQFFHPSPGRILAVLGDVAGSGVTAAMIAHEVLYASRLLSPVVQAPGDFLEALNRALIDTLGNVSLTAVAAVVEPALNRLSFATAGGPLPVRIARDGASEILVHTGQVLGVLKSMKFSTHDVETRPGDMIFLSTDGLLELGMGQQGAMDDIFRGIQTQLLHAQTAAEFEAGFQKVMGGIEQKSGLRDDLALAALYFTPGPS